MSAINSNALKYLTEADHNSEEMASFSLKRGKEDSSRTKIANVFRGSDKRCLELFEQYQLILQDKRDLTPDQKKHLRKNAEALFKVLQKSDDEIIRDSANSVRQSLVVRALFSTDDSSDSSSESLAQSEEPGGDSPLHFTSASELREDLRVQIQAKNLKISKAIHDFSPNDWIDNLYRLSKEFDPVAELRHGTSKELKKKKLDFSQEVANGRIEISSDSLESVKKQAHNKKIIDQIRKEYLLDPLTEENDLFTRFSPNKDRSFPPGSGDREKAVKDFFSQVARGEFLLPDNAIEMLRARKGKR